MLAPRGQ